MDKWNEDQFKRMDLGGNKNAADFFRAHPHFREGMSIPEKYNSEFARFYKEKLKAMVEGRPYEMPPPGPMPAPAAPSLGDVSTASAGSGASAARGRSHVDAQYRASTGPSAGAMPQLFSAFSDAPSQQQQQQQQSSLPPTDKARTESFFAQKGTENLSRPDGVSPSQGGRYAGFGSSPFNPQAAQTESDSSLLDDPLKTLSKGWSIFSSYAVEGAKLAATNAERVGQVLTENVGPL
eukprot:jgi/Hompol1/6715/HPOL_005054-RA